jgi:hypothetical protein
MIVEYSLPPRTALRVRFIPAHAVDGAGKSPRIARIVALAHKLDALVRSGTVRNYGELACLGHITPARLSQILVLTQLAPAIQERVLFLSEAEAGQINERELRKIARQWRWDIQLEMFQVLLGS